MKLNLPSMKINPSSRHHAILWIGETDHAETQTLWRWCQDHCDCIAIRSSLEAAIASPPRSQIDCVLIVRTRRHDGATVPSNDDDIAHLRRQHPQAKLLLVRGSMVAPSVVLPPSDPMAPSRWIESISCQEVTEYLSATLETSSDQFSCSKPIVIVASQYTLAEVYIDALQMMSSTDRWITWQRELSANQSRGNATILWDDSAAPPVSQTQWQRRLSVAPQAKHLWATGIATPEQCQTARRGGVAAIIEKPGRLDCLLQAINSGNNASKTLV